MTTALDPDETVSHLLTCEDLAVGSRIGGAVLVPVQPRPDAPKLVFTDPRWPLPAAVIARGEFFGNDWADDPAIGMWAEAARADQDAARLAEEAAAGRGIVAILATHKRVAVGFPAKFLGERSGKSWDPGDPVHLQHSVPSSRVAGIAPVMLGRSIPAPTFDRVAFTDGSLLFVRKDPYERGAMLAKEMNRR